MRRYGFIGEKNYEGIIKALSKIAAFGRVDGFLGMKFPASPMSNNKPSWDYQKLRWFLRELGELDIDSKANLIRRVFYDVLNLLEKRWILTDFLD